MSRQIYFLAAAFFEAFFFAVGFFGVAAFGAAFLVAALAFAFLAAAFFDAAELFDAAGFGAAGFVSFLTSISFIGDKAGRRPGLVSFGSSLGLGLRRPLASASARPRSSSVMPLLRSACPGLALSEYMQHHC